MRSFRQAAVYVTCLSVISTFAAPQAAYSQPITAADDGTGTSVTSSSSNPSQFDIGGGTRAGENLFHSFKKFGLSEGEIANFLSNPEIENILGRVTGGDASFIDGLIKMQGGSSNLFLMNPAGVLFGRNARIDLPGDFSATTATGIQMNDYWFKALGENNYGNLIGDPSAFAFTRDAAGTVLNAGELEVESSQSIRLLGGLVINTGTVRAPGGEIVIEAVPGEGLVSLTQEGSLLSLGLPVDAEAALNDKGLEPVTPLALPQLLVETGLTPAAGVEVVDGVVKLTGARPVELPTEAGVAIASGVLDASSDSGQGGRIDLLGERVGVIDGSLNASGELGGGSIRVGGDYKGQGTVQNAAQTFVGAAAELRADAVESGDGGEVVVWADGSTRFYGAVSAQGGRAGGDGGFVEVSGKEVLAFDGVADVSAPFGKAGQLLFDPKTVVLVASNESEDDTELDDDRKVLADDGEADEIFEISSSKLAELLATGNVEIAASEEIIIGDPTAEGDVEIVAEVGSTSKLFLTAPTMKAGSEQDSPDAIRALRTSTDLDLTTNEFDGVSFVSDGNIEITALSDDEPITGNGDSNLPLTIDAAQDLTLNSDASFTSSADLRAGENITTEALTADFGSSNLDLFARDGDVEVNKGIILSAANLNITAGKLVRIGVSDTEISPSPAVVRIEQVDGLLDFLKKNLGEDYITTDNIGRNVVIRQSVDFDSKGITSIDYFNRIQGDRDLQNARSDIKISTEGGKNNLVSTELTITRIDDNGEIRKGTLGVRIDGDEKFIIGPPLASGKGLERVQRNALPVPENLQDEEFLLLVENEDNEFEFIKVTSEDFKNATTNKIADADVRDERRDSDTPLVLLVRNELYEINQDTVLPSSTSGLLGQIDVNFAFDGTLNGSLRNIVVSSDENIENPLEDDDDRGLDSDASAVAIAQAENSDDLCEQFEEGNALSLLEIAPEECQEQVQSSKHVESSALSKKP